jgi:hypothetical protein
MSIWRKLTISLVLSSINLINFDESWYKLATTRPKQTKHALNNMPNQNFLLSDNKGTELINQ